MSSKQKVVVLTGGGTAGHVTPAIALAEKLQARGVKVYFAGTPSGMESRLVPSAGIEYKGFEASGFNRSHPMSLVKGVLRISKSIQAAKKWFKEIEPDAVVGFGGYASIPVARAAEDMKVPAVLHEPNGVLGMANKFMAGHASAITVANLESAANFDESVRDKVKVTGNPVREALLETTREEGRVYAGVPEDATMLLVTSGSLGARHLNNAVAAMKDELLSRPGLYVYHVTGNRDYDAIKAMLSLSPEEEERYKLVSYEDHMPEVMAASDAIVSRSGASSMAEIAALAIPAILVPFPHATENHQVMNAKPYDACGAAFMVPDDKVDGDEFKEKLLQLVDDADLRANMKAAFEARGSANAAEAIADIVMGLM